MAESLVAFDTGQSGEVHGPTHCRCECSLAELAPPCHTYAYVDLWKKQEEGDDSWDMRATMSPQCTPVALMPHYPLKEWSMEREGEGCKLSTPHATSDIRAKQMDMDLR